MSPGEDPRGRRRGAVPQRCADRDDATDPDDGAAHGGGLGRDARWRRWRLW